jgi:hypothetical protein
MGDQGSAALLCGFVLSVRPSEVLLTFPELLELPEGLESEVQVTVRYGDSSGTFAAVGRIARVAAGPPVTLTFKRLAPVRVAARVANTDVAVLDRQRATRNPASGPPVSIQVVSSRVALPLGPQGAAAAIEELSDDSLVVVTSVLLAVGDTLRIVVGVPGNGSEPGYDAQGRVVRVFEHDSRFGVGVELVHRSGEEQRRWHDFVLRRQQAEGSSV